MNNRGFVAFLFIVGFLLAQFIVAFPLWAFLSELDEEFLLIAGWIGLLILLALCIGSFYSKLRVFRILIWIIFPLFISITAWEYWSYFRMKQYIEERQNRYESIEELERQMDSAENVEKLDSLMNHGTDEDELDRNR